MGVERGRYAAAAHPGARLRPLGLGARSSRVSLRDTASSPSTTVASASSDKPEGPYTAAQMAGDALQVLDEAGIERAHVIGASLGGMIAQELAVAAPERVDRLVLCCTTPGRAGRGADARGDAAAVRGGAVARARGGAAALRRERAGRRPAGRSSSTSSSRSESPNPPDPAGWQAQAAAGMGFQGVDGRDHRADADPRRHCRQRRRLSQRGAARRPNPGRPRRAARGRAGISSSGSSRTSASSS